MRRILPVILVFGLSQLLIVSCKKDDPIEKVSREIIATNKWIDDNMSLYYLWNEFIPTGIDYTRESDPKAFFFKLLYRDLDKWSQITDDYPKLESELNGDPVTMGYRPAFYLTGNNNVIIVVSYVYPGSPAEEAGLKRGNIILSIDNKQLDTTNYQDLYSGTSYQVQLGAVVGNSLVYTGESLNMTARTTMTDPAIYYQLFEQEGHKIGYLVYVEFIKGPNEMYLRQLDNIFNEFKAEGISDLIIDLRYNPGGEVDAAVYLASLIAPAPVATGNETLVNLNYNHDLQQYMEYNNHDDLLSYKFTNTTSNIGLNRVCFLTTSSSASASELVIIGLDPYMEVILVGEPTFGKYTGAWVIPDDNMKWAIMPIVSKFSNSVGFTDFFDGLMPDHQVDDDLFSAVPFGDLSDPMVAKALEQLTGIPPATPKKSAVPGLHLYKKIIPPQQSIRNNLILPQPGMKLK